MRISDWSSDVCSSDLGMNYGPADDPLKLLEMRTRGSISVYARGRDYHDVVKSRLKQLAGFIHARFAAEVKVFVDTAPVMEKPQIGRASCRERVCKYV